ncbi:MAG: sn-glycerol-1-phosphate dehydrogenase [Clostridiaceae bacterium]|nr:sn-glycerol-1-phosphate dehydrogenase [Clostridiaceae bacterium]
MRILSEMRLTELISPQGFDCDCGKHHVMAIRHVKIGERVIEFLPEILQDLAINKPLFVADQNTYQAAWQYIEPVLCEEKINYEKFIFQEEHLEPNEYAVGSLTMAYDRSCDGIVVIGSGVLNDIGKVFAHAAKLPQVVIATAASMDGYGSNNASMIQNGLKVSLYNACPQAIIADTRILAEEPMHMLQAGLGDMLAKYVSICEWRISHLITGEYYCENIANLVRSTLKKIIDSADGLLYRKQNEQEKIAEQDRLKYYQAIENIFEGLLITGLAMGFAEMSRPASGLEHYFSHVWEMMSLQRGEIPQLHGLQVAVGTLLSVEIWQKLHTYAASSEDAITKAGQFIDSFDSVQWENMVQRIYGNKTAKQIIATANAEGRNNKLKHAERLSIIKEKWHEIINIVESELPSYEDLISLMRKFNLPLSPQEIGYSEQDKRDALIGSREVRNKYVTSSLLWDLGLLYEWEI